MRTRLAAAAATLTLATGSLVGLGATSASADDTYCTPVTSAYGWQVYTCFDVTTAVFSQRMDGTLASTDVRIFFRVDDRWSIEYSNAGTGGTLAEPKQTYSISMPWYAHAPGYKLEAWITESGRTVADQSTGWFG
ncbi:hypothetical protein ABZ915_46660 [Streptomyces sp. NPDC046915]|uniref:hypothetical protein n=1 Tax=Streptomyces sp. NPDC046915 TaxID=3155257 RepID=UPI00340D90E1